MSASEKHFNKHVMQLGQFTKLYSTQPNRICQYRCLSHAVNVRTDHN